MTAIAGIGIHSGAPCTVRLHRYEGPVRFVRGRAAVPASLDAVAGTRRCTTLAGDGIRVAMVEHLLAALHVTGWWSGVTIEVTGEELPILDGSAEPWLEPISALGERPPIPAPAVPTRAFEVAHGASSVSWRPGGPEICCTIAFDHPGVGRQSWCGEPSRYDQLLAARTFGFLDEADALRHDGLAKGASTENAIVFSEEGPMRPLRTPHEPVRHKALDLLGDLFLLERPLAGRVTATRGSHALHIDFMRRLDSVLHASTGPHA